MGKKSSNIFSMLSLASTMGLHMVSGPIVGGFIGWLVDKYFPTAPYGIVIGLVCGFGAGYINVMHDNKRLKNEIRDIENAKKMPNIIEEKPSDEHIEYDIFGNEKKIDLKENSEHSAKK